MRGPLAAAVVALACAGCGHVELHEVPLHPPLPPSGRDVDVYMEGQGLPRPFHQVALLQAIGYGTDADMEDVVRALSRRARELGCDAVASVTFEQGYSLAHGFGVCVKYDAPPAAGASTL